MSRFCEPIEDNADEVDKGERRRLRRIATDVISKLRISASLTPEVDAMALLSELSSDASGVCLDMVMVKLTDTATVSAAVGVSEGALVGGKEG